MAATMVNAVFESDPSLSCELSDAWSSTNDCAWQPQADVFSSNSFSTLTTPSAPLDWFEPASFNTNSVESTSDAYDRKYGITVPSALAPNNAVITDNGPSFAENISTILDAGSVGASVYMGIFGLPTQAASLLSLAPSFAKLAPSAGWLKQVAIGTKVSASTILADNMWHFGELINDMVDHKTTMRNEIGDFANWSIGGNKSLSINIDGYKFKGISINCALVNASDFYGQRDAEGNIRYQDGIFCGIGFKSPGSDRVAGGTANGLNYLAEGIYLKANATTPTFGFSGGAKTIYVNLNPFSDKFLDGANSFQNFVVNSNIPKTSPGDFDYSIGYYAKFDTNARSTVRSWFSGWGESDTPETKVASTYSEPIAIPPMAKHKAANDSAEHHIAKLPKTANQDLITYKVGAGDTLSDIAKLVYRNGGSYQQLFTANKSLLSNPDRIYPGQVLKIPGGSKLATHWG